MKNDGFNAVFQQVTEMIKRKYGMEALVLAQRKLKLKESLRHFVEKTGVQLVGQDDINSAARMFLDPLHVLLSRRKTKEPLKGERRFSSPDRGSLRNLAAYADALPILIRARQDLLGQKEPLTHEEAVDWILQEAKHSSPVEFIEVTLRISVPKKTKLLEKCGFWTRKTDQLGWRLPDALITELEAHFRNRSDVDTLPAWYGPKSRSIGILQNGRKERIEMDRGRLISLADWAESLESECGGFQEAVWLILTGIWPHIGATGVFQPGPLLSNRFQPVVTFKVYELETTPDELAQLYSNLRKDLQFGGKGPRFSRETEVLGLLALEVKEILNVKKGDRGFYLCVLQHWRKRAEFNGLDPKHFRNPDVVRKALDRLQKAYSEQALRMSSWFYPPDEPELFK